MQFPRRRPLFTSVVRFAITLGMIASVLPPPALPIDAAPWIEPSSVEASIADSRDMASPPPLSVENIDPGSLPAPGYGSVLAATLPNDAPHKYAIFIDGINTSSSPSEPVPLRFSTVRSRLTQPQIRDGYAGFISFSYAAARWFASEGTPTAYRRGWENSDFRQTPVYFRNDTHISVHAQVQALDWLLGEIVSTDPLAQVDLIGFSLGGVIANRWASLPASRNGAVAPHIHSIVTLGSPLNGIPLAGLCLNNPNDLRCVASSYFYDNYGLDILNELKVDGAGTIIPSLTGATEIFDLTAIESTQDYIVNGQPLQVCLATCAATAPVEIGKGASFWVPRAGLTVRQGNLAGSAAGAIAPWEIDRVVSLNHSPVLFHPSAGTWVREAAAAESGFRWSSLHRFTGSYTSVAGVVGQIVRLEAAATSSLPIHHVNMTALYGGNWHVIARFIGPGPYSFDWDSSGIPDSEVTLGFDVFDQTGGIAYSPGGTRTITRGGPGTPSLLGGIAVTPSPATPGNNVNIAFDIRNTGNQPLLLSEAYLDGHGPDGYWKAWACGGPNGQPACANQAGLTTRRYTAVLLGSQVHSSGTWSVEQQIVYYTAGGYSVVATNLGSFPVSGSAAPTVELEPNNAQAQASPLALGVPITGTFFRASGTPGDHGGDTDWYRVTIPAAGRLTIQFTPPSTGGNITTTGSSFNLQLWHAAPSPGISPAYFSPIMTGNTTLNDIAFDASQVGAYDLLLCPHNCASILWSDQPYALTATFAPFPTGMFAGEPANDIASTTTTVLPLNSPTQGYFARSNRGHLVSLNFGDDGDWYKLTIPAAGQLTLTFTPPAGGGNWPSTSFVVANLYDSTGSFFQFGGTVSSGPQHLAFDSSQVGEYRLQLCGNGCSNWWSDQPYTITATFTPFLAGMFADEPANDSPTQTTAVLPLGTPTQGYFARTNRGVRIDGTGLSVNFGDDGDWYKLTIPVAGQLTLNFTPPAGGGNWSSTSTVIASIYDLSGAFLRGSGTISLAGGGGPQHFAFDPSQVGEYRLHLCAGAGCTVWWSDQPYTLTATFTPFPTGMFAGEPANDIASTTSTVLPLGTPTQGYFARSNRGTTVSADFSLDLDVYKVAIPSAGTLTLVITQPVGGGNYPSNGTPYEISVSDSFGGLRVHEFSRGPSEFVFSSSEVGEYRLSLSANACFCWSDQPYTVTALFQPVTGTPGATGPNTPPTISDIPNQTTAADTPVTVNFTVGDTQTAAGSLVVTASSSNQTLVPNGNLAVGVTDAGRTLTISPALGQSGEATITVTVTDAGGMTASDSFMLTVGAASASPSVTVNPTSGPPGTPFTLTGANFIPNRALNIFWDVIGGTGTCSGQSIGGINSASGAFTFNGNIPFCATAGAHQIVAADAGTMVLQAAFTVGQATSATTANLSLSQGSAPQAVQLTLFGSGFKTSSGGEVVNVCLDLAGDAQCVDATPNDGVLNIANHLMSPLSDPQGFFQQSFFIDASKFAVGSHTLRATGGSSGRTASVTLEITSGAPPPTGGIGGAFMSPRAFQAYPPPSGTGYTLQFDVSSPPGLSATTRKLNYRQHGAGATTFVAIDLTGSLDGSGFGILSGTVPATDITTDGLDIFAEVTFSDSSTARFPFLTGTFHAVVPQVSMAGQALFFEHDPPACPAPGANFSLASRARRAPGNIATSVSEATLHYRAAGTDSAFTQVSAAGPFPRTFDSTGAAGLNFTVLAADFPRAGIEMFVVVEDSDIHSVTIPPAGAGVEFFSICANAAPITFTPVNVFPMNPVAGAVTSYNISFPIDVTIPAGGAIAVGFAKIDAPNDFGFTACATSSATNCTRVPPEYKTFFGNTSGGVDLVNNGALLAADIDDANNILTFTLNTAETAPSFINLIVKGIRNTSQPSPLVFNPAQPGPPTGGYTATVKTLNDAGSPLEQFSSMPFPMNDPVGLGSNIIEARVVAAPCNFANPASCTGLNGIEVEAFAPSAGALTTTTADDSSKTGQVAGWFKFTDLNPDAYSVTARDPNDQHLALPVPMYFPVPAPPGITFTPVLALQPTTGLTQVTVNVTGGPANESVQLNAFFEGGAVTGPGIGAVGFVNKTVALNPSGSGTAVLKLPAGTWGITVMPAIAPTDFAFGGPAPQPKFFPPPPKRVNVGTDPLTVPFELVSSNLTAQIKVVDQNGAGIANAQVMVWSTDPFQPGGTGGQTDATGLFQGVLPAGDYNAKAFVPGTFFDQAEVGFSIRGTAGSEVQKPSSPLILRVDISGLTASGKLLKCTADCGGPNPTISPLSNAWLSAYGVVSATDRAPVPGQWFNTNTDSSGNFTFRGISSGSILLVRGHSPGTGPVPEQLINSGSPITEDVADANIVVNVADAVFLKVKVGELGNAGVGLEPLFPGTPSVPSRCVGTPLGGAGAPTDADGEAQITVGQRPPTGEVHCYRVRVFHPSSGGKLLATVAIASNGTVTDISGAADLDVTTGGLVTTFETGSITVNFVDASGSPVTVPDGFINVSSLTNAGNGKPVRDTSSVTIALEPGTYKLAAGARGFGHFAQADNVVVTQGGTATVTVTLPATREITVDAHEPGDVNAKIKGARVRAYKKGAAGESSAFTIDAETDANGRAVLRVPQGADYEVLVSKGDRLPTKPKLVTNITADTTLPAFTPPPTTGTGLLSITGKVSEGNATVACYEDDGDGVADGTIIVTASSNGDYTCPAQTGKNYLIKAFKEGKETKDADVKRVTALSSSATGQNITLSSKSGFTAKKGKEKTQSESEPLNVIDPESKVELNAGSGALGSSSSNVTIVTKDVTGDVPDTSHVKNHKTVEISAKKTSTGLALTNLNSDVTVVVDASAEAGLLTATEHANLKLGEYDPKTGEIAVNDKSTVSVETDAQGSKKVKVSAPTKNLSGTKFSVVTVLSAGVSTILPSTPPPPGGGGGGGGGGGSPKVTPTPVPAPTTFVNQTINTAAGGTVSLGESVSIQIPGGAVSSGTGSVTATLEAVTLTGQGSATVMAAQQTLPVPEGSLFGSNAFTLTLRDAAGSDASVTAAFNVTARFNASDLDKAAGNAAALRLMAYDAVAKRWVDLRATADAGRLTLTGSTMRAGLFAVVIELAKPVLVGPAAGFLSTDLAPLLSWTNPGGTTQFQVQVIPHNNDGPGINLIRNAESEYQAMAPVFGQGNYVMLPGMTYTWRVRTSTSATGLAETDAGWSGWVSGSFKTAAPTSSTIGIVGPIPGSEVAGKNPTLTWTNIDPKVFYYEVQVSKDKDFGTDAFLYWELRHGAVSTPQNSYKIPDAFPLEAGTTYHWRVRPRVQGDGTPVAWSQVWRFMTPPD